MKVLSRKYQFNADMEHVIHCFTNLKEIAKAVTFFDKGTKLKTVLKNDGLYLVAKKPLIRISQFTADTSGIYRAQLTPMLSSLKQFGYVNVFCTFSATDKGTLALTTLESEKTPNLLWRAIIRLIIFILVFQSRTDEKKYILWVEQQA